ncbi:MAG: helix-turn-helix transcriptional regulator [Eubacterium sp.]|nr:helix-turn-helix transcriptional regulator [Eubacterium sp.]
MADYEEQRIYWGNILRKIRYKHGLTQLDVATVLHVTRQAYSNLECGKRNPSPETIAILSDLYETDLFSIGLNSLPKEAVEERNRYKVIIQRSRPPRDD